MVYKKIYIRNLDIVTAILKVSRALQIALFVKIDFQ